MPPTPRSIAIARQSWSLFQQLVYNPGSSYPLLKALRAIQQDSTSGSAFYGGPLQGGAFQGIPMRKDMVQLGDRQLWLFWHPAMDPIEISLAMTQFRP